MQGEGQPAAGASAFRVTRSPGWALAFGCPDGAACGLGRATCAEGCSGLPPALRLSLPPPVLSGFSPGGRPRSRRARA
eukprot:7612933-Pyramimonas_sp.AAC.1